MNVQHCSYCSNVICHAVKKGDIQLVQYCITNTPGLDLEINYDGNSQCLPLLWRAALDGLLEVAKLLIRSGVDINGKIVGACELLCKDTHKRINQPVIGSENHGLTIIEVLARCRANKQQRRSRDVRLVEYMIASGANIKTDYSVQNHSPLWHAMKNKNFEIAELLVINGADLVGPEWNEESATIIAAQCKESKKFVSLFIEYGANATKIDTNGMNAMHHLTSNQLCSGFLDTAKLLVEKGVPIDEPNHDEVRPIHLAARYLSNPWFVRYLLEEGVDVHRVDKNGQTPLHWAYKYSYGFFALKPLLEYGADVDVEDNKGKTPMSLINNRYDSSSIIVLVKHIALMNRNKEKLSFKKRKLNPEDLENEKNRLRIHEKNMSFIQSRFDLSRQYKDYVDELARMEEIELGENFTYCDVLNWPKNRVELTAVIKSAGRDIIKKFGEINLETMFPCYKREFDWILQYSPFRLNLESVLNDEGNKN